MLKLYEVTTYVYFLFTMIGLDVKKIGKIKYPQQNPWYYMQGHNSLNKFC